MSPTRTFEGISGLRRGIKKASWTKRNMRVQGVTVISLELSSGCHNTRVNRSSAGDSISCFRYLSEGSARDKASPTDSLPVVVASGP